MFMHKSKKGFTIVELVIVIAVVAILAAVLIPSFSSLNKKAKDSAYLQERTSQQIADLAEKIENQDYLTWEDFEGKLAEEIAKIEIPTGEGVTEDQVKAVVKTAVDEAVAKLQADNNSLTIDQVQTIIEKALEGQLTTAQVEAIVNAAVANLKDNDDTSEDAAALETKIQQIVDEAVAKLSKQTGVTKEEMTAAIKAALEAQAPGLKAEDVQSIVNSAISDALAGFDSGLDEDDIDEIINGAFGARVGSKGYVRMQDAINGATNGDTIVLLKDLNTETENGSLRFENKNITLDLNGNSITNTVLDQRVMLVSGTSQVTIKNGKVINEKWKTNSNIKDTNYVAIRVQDTANLTLDNVEVTSKRDAIHTAGSAIVTITGENTWVKGEYSAVKAEGSSQVFIKNGLYNGGGSNNYIITVWTNAEVTIEGGTVSAIGSSWCVVVDYVKNAKLVVEGGTFTAESGKLIDNFDTKSASEIKGGSFSIGGTIKLQPYGTITTSGTNVAVGTDYVGNESGDYWVVTAK